MFFFKTRFAQRSFASKKAHYITKDLGSSAPAGRRWGVAVLKSKTIRQAA